MSPDLDDELDRRRSRAILAGRVMVALAAIAVGATVASGVVVTYLNRATLEELRACTTPPTAEQRAEPGLTCYEHGERQTAKALVGIRKLTLEAVTAVEACANRHPVASSARLRACANRTLDRRSVERGAVAHPIERRGP